MRSKHLGIIREAYDEFSEDQTLKMFEKMCDIRHFEENVKKAFNEGLIKMPFYLSIGQEAIPAALSMVYKKPAIFGQHRAHGYYLAHGGNEKDLVDEMLHKETGCAQGMGGSASIHSPEIKMMGHDGLMGSNIPIATGYAFAENFGKTQRSNVLAVMGDSAAEEDYVGSSLGWAATKKLPILYVCEDNNLSILTEVKVRRNWKMSDLAEAYGLKSIDITDDPWTIMYYAKKLQENLPAFMNIHTSRDVWHAGAERDNPPKDWSWWKRFELVEERLIEKGLAQKIMKIKSNSEERMNALWESKIN
tara:strand:- start:10557 stop:11468 length:912 start_codon:yes stop_codon:yes gene_type:complete